MDQVKVRDLQFAGDEVITVEPAGNVVADRTAGIRSGVERRG
jgi:hypothetical protein